MADVFSILQEDTLRQRAEAFDAAGWDDLARPRAIHKLNLMRRRGVVLASSR